MTSMEERRKADRIIWYLMATFASIIIIGGGAWAKKIDEKVDKIPSLEANVQVIQTDISLIKIMIEREIQRGG